MGGTFEENDPGLYDRLNENELTFAGDQPFRRALDQVVLAANRGFFGSDFMANTIEGSKTELILGAAAMTLNKIGFARSVLKAYPDSHAGGTPGFQSTTPCVWTAAITRPARPSPSILPGLPCRCRNSPATATGERSCITLPTIRI